MATPSDLLKPLDQWFNTQIDRRLVRSFFSGLQPIVRFRHSRFGLILNNRVGNMIAPSKAPPGTKRLSHLLRSSLWSYILLPQFLWRLADQTLDKLDGIGNVALVIWDESVLEKQESSKLEVLCPVRTKMLFG